MYSDEEPSFSAVALKEAIAECGARSKLRARLERLESVAEAIARTSGKGNWQLHDNLQKMAGELWATVWCEDSVVASRLVIFGHASLEPYLARERVRRRLISGPIRSVFLAHASEDDLTIDGLAGTLELSCGLRVWHDKIVNSTEIAPRDMLQLNIANVDCIVVVLTKSSAMKPWVSQEVGIATKAKKRIIVFAVAEIVIPAHLCGLESCVGLQALLRRIQAERLEWKRAPSTIRESSGATIVCLVVILVLLFIARGCA